MPTADILAPFRQPAFAAVWAGGLAVNVGNTMFGVAMAWTVARLSNSAEWIGLVHSASSLPILLFSLLAGAIADRFSRKHIMILSQGLNLVTTATAAVGLVLGWMPVGGLLLCTFVVGSCMAVRGPAWNATVGNLVPRQQVPQAVSLNSIAFNVARGAGPAAAGLIIALTDAPAVLWICAGASLAMILLLSSWREQTEGVTATSRIIPLMVEGLTYIAASGRMQAVLIRCCLFGLAGSVLWALMPVLAAQHSADARLLGLFYAAFGIGSILGAVIASLVREWPCDRTLCVAGLAFFTGTAAIAAGAGVYVSLLLLCLAGAAWVVTLVAFNVTVQRDSPRPMIGRAMALYQAAVFGGMALGGAVWGHAAESLTLASSLFMAAAVGLTGLVLPAFRRFRLS